MAVTAGNRRTEPGLSARFATSADNFPTIFFILHPLFSGEHLLFILSATLWWKRGISLFLSQATNRLSFKSKRYCFGLWFSKGE